MACHFEISISIHMDLQSFSFLKNIMPFQFFQPDVRKAQMPIYWNFLSDKYSFCVYLCLNNKSLRLIWFVLGFCKLFKIFAGSWIKIVWGIPSTVMCCAYVLYYSTTFFFTRNSWCKRGMYFHCSVSFPW